MLAINYKNRVFMADKTARILFNKGVQAQKEGNYREAVSFYKSALKLDPLFRGAFLNLGALYSRGRQYEKAYRCYAKGYQLGEDPGVYFKMASILYRLDQKTKSAQMLDNLLRRKPDMIPAYFVAAQVHEDLGNDQRAEQYLKGALTYDPGNKKALTSLALYYYERRQEEKALHFLNILLRKYPSETVMAELRANLQVKTGDYKQALDSYKRLIHEKTEYKVFEEKLGAMDPAERQKAFGDIDQKISAKSKEVRRRMEEAKKEGRPLGKESARDLVDLSFYHLFKGQPEEGVKYLLAAKRTGDGPGR